MKKSLYLAVGLLAVALNAGAKDIAISGSIDPLNRNNWEAAMEWQGLAFISICGDATTVNNNTVYYGPGITLTANIPFGQNCDITAAGNATEATADAAAFTSTPYRILGMTCRNQADQNAAITYRMRVNAANVTPNLACTIADNVRDCIANVDVSMAPVVKAATPIAIAVSSTADVGVGMGFACTIAIAY